MIIAMAYSLSVSNRFLLFNYIEEYERMKVRKSLITVVMTVALLLGTVFAGGPAQAAYAEPSAGGSEELSAKTAVTDPADFTYYYSKKYKGIYITEYIGSSTAVRVPVQIGGKDVVRVDLHNNEQPIKYLSLENSKVKYLDCMNNKITTLDLSGCKSLTTLDCKFNNLQSLNVTDCKKLKILECSCNQLKKLNLSGSQNLISLRCGSNKLTSLDVTKCKKLKELDFSSNKITKINLSKCKKIVTLDCYGTGLKSLNVSALTALKELQCSYNKLTSLNVKKNANLVLLRFDHNKIKKIDVSKCKKIYVIWAHHNPGFSGIDVSKCPKLDLLELDKKISKSKLNARLKKYDPYWSDAYDCWIYQGSGNWD